MLVLGIALSLVHRDVFAQQFTFRHYGQEDGLANLAVTCLLQDQVGFLWMCTENGLFRHDGTDFERFGEDEGIENTAIHSAVEDGRGRLWLGTAHDLYLGDGHRFHAVRPDGRYLGIGPGPRLARMAPGRILFIENERLFELHGAPGAWVSAPFFTPEQRALTPALEHLTSVNVDRSGRIWLGCGTGICSVDNGAVRAWQANDGVPEDTWLPSLLDHEGGLWVRGQTHVVVLPSGATRFELRDPPHAKLTAEIVYVPLIEDRDGRVLTRTDLGLARWERGHWTELTQDNGLPAGGMYAALVARDGEVWLGSAGRGVARWQGYESFASWTTAQGFGADSVWSVLRSAHRGLVLGTRAGCYHLDEASRRAAPCRIEGLPSGEIQVMAERKDGSLWIGMTTGELLRVGLGEQRATLIATLPLMRKLFVDATDRLWICSNTGVAMVPAGTSRVTATTLPPMSGEVTDATEDASGGVWAASQGGLLRWSADRWIAVRLDDEHGRAGVGNVAIAKDGTLWAGGFTHGLVHIRLVGDRIDRTEWVQEPIVAQAAVYSTLIDARGWVWLGTDAGVAVFDGRVWRRFTQPDGLIWNDTDQNAGFIDTDGSVWMGTSGGVTHIEHPERLMQSPPIALQITRATIGAAEVDPGRPGRFAWDPSTALDLHVSDLQFGDRRRAVVKVRLRGLSDEWFETRVRDLHYPALAPGHYEFEAVALDREHQRTSELVHFAFEIVPPWWRTVWFQALVGAALASGLALVWRWRMRKLEEHKRNLEERLKEREALLVRATRDGLTGLWNRTAILEILDRGIEAARRQSTTLAIAIIDIDHFKKINDTRGHLGGDEVLRTLGTKLVEKIRRADSLGRYGGEEFLLVMPGAAQQRPFLPLERLRRSVAEIPFSFDGSPIPVTASFGVAWLESGTDTARDLLARADAALYAAKYSGRNRVEYAATG
jgi:diguanylate cyclase (GGDEF)-like protein